MNLWEFFDATSLEHRKAYFYLEERGTWPKGFIPEGTTMNEGWQISIAFKLLDYYRKRCGE